MENNSKYIEKPIYDGVLEQGEYEAVIVKAVPTAGVGEIPPSIRVMFKLDFESCVAFVSGFMGQTFKSGDKTSNWLKNLGIEPTSNVTPIDMLKGKRCKIYITPNKTVFSEKFGKNITYYKINALTPINRVLPSMGTPMAKVQSTQPTTAYASPKLVTNTVAQPVINSSLKTESNPFMSQGVALNIPQQSVASHPNYTMGVTQQPVMQQSQVQQPVLKQAVAQQPQIQQPVLQQPVAQQPQVQQPVLKQPTVTEQPTVQAVPQPLPTKSGIVLNTLDF